MELAENCNWWIPLAGMAICSEKPIKCEFNDRKELHSVSGMALEYSDGFGIYSLNGVHFDENLFKIVTSPDVTPQKVLAIKNADQKAAAIAVVAELKKK